MSSTFVKVMINGREREFPQGITFLSIAREMQSEYENDIVLAVFNNHMRELSDQLTRSGTLSFLTTGEKQGRECYRRGLVFLMVSAAFQCFKDYQVRVQYPLRNGYYCEFYKDGKVVVPSEEMLSDLQSKMTQMVKEDRRIERIDLDINDVRNQAEKWGQKDKSSLLKYRMQQEVSVYTLGGYYDYFYGLMLPGTSYLRYHKIKKYQEGFMLLFPTGNATKIEKFTNLDKLYKTFDEADEWSQMIGIRTVGALNETIASGHVQDLILVNEALMEERIARIASNIAENNKIKFVLIAGPSSSGKTTFSHRLSIQLRAKGKVPHPIAMDDFYVNRDQTPVDEDGKLDFECVEALDIPLFNENLNALLAGETVAMPTFNFKTGMREYSGNTLTLGSDDILVIEGIHGLNDRLTKDIPKSSRFKIYISALTQLNMDYHNRLSTTDCRLIRRMVRDARTRNTPAKATIERWNSVRRGEERHIFPFQETADVIFNSALVYEMPVLKAYAEPLLYQIESDCPEFAEARRLLAILDYFLPVPSDSVGHNSILREFIGGGCFHA